MHNGCRDRGAAGPGFIEFRCNCQIDNDKHRCRWLRRDFTDAINEKLSGRYEELKLLGKEFNVDEIPQFQTTIVPWNCVGGAGILGLHFKR